MKVEHTFENKPKRQEDEGVSNASGNTYGIKFDGEIFEHSLVPVCACLSCVAKVSVQEDVHE